MMYKLLLIALLGTFTASAQKQTYFLVAYCQKQINGICGEKIMIKQDEVSLMPAETITYRSKLYTEIRATYSKGYTNFFVELVAAGQAVIVYESEKTFTPQKDGWDCTTTSYGRVRGNDMLAAEKAFAALQAEYKRSTFKELRRWGKPADITMTCKDLISFRDNDLLKIWSKYRIGSQQVSDIKRLKAELEDDSRYETSNWHILSIALKTLANAIEDIYGVVSPKGKIVNLVSSVSQKSLKALKVTESFKKGIDVLNNLVSYDAARDIAIQTATEIGQIGKAFSFVNNLSENVLSFKELALSRKELNRQLKVLDNAIISYQLKFDNPEANFKEISNYKNYIDEYLRENCKN